MSVAGRSDFWPSNNVANLPHHILVSRQFAVILLVLASLAAISCQDNKCKDEHSWDNLYHFSELGLVPNLIPCEPKHTATIYHNEDDFVLVGNRLTPRQVKNEPTIKFPAFQRNVNYTIMLIDADAPSRESPELSPYLHFLAVNSFEMVIGTSDKVATYQSPLPPPGTGYHRYVWLLYKQNGRIEPETLDWLKYDRSNFPLEDFIANNNLTVPTAGNYFQTQS